MKALSIWQPWATLIMTGHKRIETRGWAAPYSIRGQRIAIAATKTIRTEQRHAAQEPHFREHYSATGLPVLTTSLLVASLARSSLTAAGRSTLTSWRISARERSRSGSMLLGDLRGF